MYPIIEEKRRTTLSSGYTRNLAPVLCTQLQYPCLKPDSLWNFHFEPEYRIFNREVIRLPHGITKEVETINSVIEIGNILLKDGRDISPDESAAIHSYTKKKYMKIRKRDDV